MMPSGLLHALLGLGTAALLLAASCASEGRGAEAGDPPRFRSVTLDARRPPEPGSLERLRDLGITHLTVIPFGWQQTTTSPDLHLRPDANWYSESDSGIHALSEAAAALGMGLIIKPQLWLGRTGDGVGWSANIAMTSEADWQAWEERYRRFMMHYAGLARDVDADLLVIGTELGAAAAARPTFFRTLAAEVRTVYGGPITYAANWHDDYETLAFWDALDYVGIQAYFPLADTSQAALSVEALCEAWTPHKEAIARVQATTGRPVVFTELGYRSVPFAAAEPWRWPSRDEAGRVPPDMALQANLYQAFFETYWHEPWFEGAIVWKWYPSAPGRRPRELGFTPQDKPAEAVLARWFGKDKDRRPGVER